MLTEEYHGYTGSFLELIKLVRAIQHDVEEIMIHTYRKMNNLDVRFENNNRYCHLHGKKIDETDPEYDIVLTWPISQVKVFITMKDYSCKLYCESRLTKYKTYLMVEHNANTGCEYREEFEDVDFTTLDFNSVMKCAKRNIYLGCKFHSP